MTEEEKPKKIQQAPTPEPREILMGQKPTITEVSTPAPRDVLKKVKDEDEKK